MQKESLMRQFQQNSYLADNNAGYIEDLYESFLKNPASVNEEWRHYFQSLANGQAQPDVSHASVREQFRQLAQQSRGGVTQVVSTLSAKQGAVDELIDAHRLFGHLNANLDPLGMRRSTDPRLELSHYGLTQQDLTQQFTTKGVLEKPQATLKEIYEQLRKIYCGSIGAEYNTITNEKERHWLRNYIEHGLQTSLPTKTRRNILQQLIAAETLEKYLDAKYVGQMRFSLEGGDSLIPMLDELTVRARRQDVQEIVICMAHRGRINVLLNIMGQSPAELFQEFEGTKDYGLSSGDVKYHNGYSRDVKTEAGAIHLSLAFNPSHLEFICPVAMGSVRARQEREYHQKPDYAMTVMIHGDAAFSGVGVVMETLSMSQTRAYYVGGSIHIILNNQIGFTTSDPCDLRSSHYCSDLAKMLDSPIFHVNGDDPEAVVAITQLALDYRMTFHKDVFIDLVCYRRYGHQEIDDPAPTQPVMYQVIDKHLTTPALYADKLIAEKVCITNEITEWKDKYRQALDQGRQVVETIPQGLSAHYAANWTAYLKQDWMTKVDTAVPLQKIKLLGEKFTTFPPNFKLHPKCAAIYEARRQMTAGKLPIDWGYAELMAYATLLSEGVPLRLVGEDTRRGTFFHRHAVVFDQNTGEAYQALQHLAPDQARAQVYDSLLSECGTMGFEYGYSTADPKSLVIWEAQYGDFANVAQVIIDQFISSGYQKWSRLSGLVLFLPHGYQGAGPEHSSARLERFLQLCAQDNMQVCVPSTPAQIFHLLRRQVLRPYRKPLIIMTPKSLLRHKLVVSSLTDLSQGQLQLVIPEVDPHQPEEITRIVLCSGKVYYDLIEKRRAEKIKHIAVIRVEQLYPFPYDDLSKELAKYPRALQVIWCQEEPKNQGAWFCTRHRLVKCLREQQKLKYVGCPASAAPAPGYTALFKKLQTQLVNEALSLN